MFWLLFFFILGTTYAEEAGIDHSIIVQASRDLELYVAPIQVRNETEDIEAVISDYSVFRYVAAHSHNAKVGNGYGGHEPLTLNHAGFKIYNEDTIKYAWEGCDYRKDAKKCSYDNNHYLLETYVTVDKHQLVVEMILYDPELQPIATGSQTRDMIIKWIKQQEVTTNISQQGVLPQQQTTTRSCNKADGSCKPTSQLLQNPGNYQRDVNISKPKEELPLRWEIPHYLLDRHISQASIKLWTGVKLKW